MDSWAIAFFPLVGVVLGALLQFWLSRAAEREKHGDTLRTQAYADYLRAVAAAAHLRTEQDLRGAFRDAADAKARIAVYGSAPVIKALARFEEAGAVLTGDRSSRAFVELVSSMRPGSSALPDRDLEIVLLGTSGHEVKPHGPPRRG
jgi:hypothetical protein